MSGAVWSIAKQAPEVRVVDPGVLEKLVQCLSVPNESLQERAAGALACLCHGQNQNKVEAGRAGAISSLLTLAKETSSAQRQALIGLGNLGVVMENVEEFQRCDGKAKLKRIQDGLPSKSPLKPICQQVLKNFKKAGVPEGPGSLKRTASASSMASGVSDVTGLSIA
mmetsp:Transcript_37266/g.86644  ORF Transcript_37266/g.86644 Transcript_37266/m.86644 type:complete len:167 (-) Transcript_37266:58-558(-)